MLPLCGSRSPDFVEVMPRTDQRAEGNAAMSAIDTARNAVNLAIDALVTRRRATSDPTEKDGINAAIEELQAQRSALDQSELAEAAQAVAMVTRVLQEYVKAAQAGPLDAGLATLKSSIGDLQTAQTELFTPGRLGRASDEPTGTAPLPAPAPEMEEAAALPPVGTGKDFQSLAGEYRACFDVCQPAAEHETTIRWSCEHLVKSRDIYTGVGNGLGIPWYFVGLIHGMESGFNFETHLHNGDPLSARTVHDPKGRPRDGTPPFTWSDSATDALRVEGFANQADWTLPRALWRLEAYNGFGYRRHGLRTPYLWSFSNLYVGGKYVADGKFDPNAASQQCGAGVVLKRLIGDGVLQLRADGSLGA
jgi:lysozyme family protein